MLVHRNTFLFMVTVNLIKYSEYLHTAFCHGSMKFFCLHP